MPARTGLLDSNISQIRAMLMALCQLGKLSRINVELILIMGNYAVFTSSVI